MRTALFTPTNLFGSTLCPGHPAGFTRTDGVSKGKRDERNDIAAYAF
jgi:hypothetical protein